MNILVKQIIREGYNFCINFIPRITVSKDFFKLNLVFQGEIEIVITTEEKMLIFT